MGTLIPQTQASYTCLLICTGGGSLLAGAAWFLWSNHAGLSTITTLVYFHFGAQGHSGGPQRQQAGDMVGLDWQVFIAITLGMTSVCRGVLPC